MSDYTDVLEAISELESLVAESEVEGPFNYRSLWDHIRNTSNLFKGVRFPSNSEHQEAWDRFQGLVERVKRNRDKNSEAFKERVRRSASIRDTLIAKADFVLPSEWGDLVMAIMTGGLSVIANHALESILGPFDQQKQELLDANARMKSLWNSFSEQKPDIIGEDKQKVWEKLRSIQERLDNLWQEYKEGRSKALDEYYEAKRQKHEAWKQKTLDNIQQNRDRISSLEGALDHKKSHLSRLYEKLEDANSDGYKSAVEGWISNEIAAIADIEGSIAEIQSWIDEDMDRIG